MGNRGEKRKYSEGTGGKTEKTLPSIRPTGINCLRGISREPFGKIPVRGTNPRGSIRGKIETSLETNGDVHS